MKKLISLLIVAFSLALAPAEKLQAQSATLSPLRAGDTLVTTASLLDTVSRVLPCTAGYASMALQFNFTKTSGTVASVKAYLYGSLDGVNYVVTDSSAVFTDITTNVAQFTKTDPQFTYYKPMVRNIGATGAACGGIVRLYYVFKKHD